ncbi:phage minor structural protein [Desulfitispora alkaliphila]|uniref:phage tail spike protein n=1 Tax=Desulfitispora alkaliphila TaxID=622674 RepID=UPI003D18FDA6
MITVYDKKESNFSSNGLGILDKCSECKTLEKLNGIYEIKLSYPLHLEKKKHLKPFNIIKADGQLFRIYHVEKDTPSNLLRVSGRHIFYDLNHYFIEDRRAVDKKAIDAMEMVLEESGLVGTYTVESDIEALNTQYFIRRSASQAMFMVANRWKGELFRDNFHIKINGRHLNDKGVTVAHGKNITGINEKLSADEVLTGIYPVGAEGITLPEKYLINAQWSGADYPDFKLIKRVDFKEAKDEETLRQMAENYLYEHAGFAVNYQVDFIQLEHTREYEEYKPLLKVSIGDTVTVKHKLLGVDFKIKVISIEKDILRSQNTKVELGKPLYTLDQYIEEFKENVDENFQEVDESIGGIRTQLDDLGVSYTIVKNIRIEENMIHVTYEVERGSTHQYHADYSFTLDDSGRMTSITLEGILSKLLLKEVSTLTVDMTSFDIVYADGKKAKYNYTTDSSGRITAIEKVWEGE